MRSIEGKMRGRIVAGKLRGNVKQEYAICAVCKETIPPGIRVRAMIEQDTKDGRPGIYLAHPACLKHYLARNPDLRDHRNDESAIPDAVVRRFWVGLDVKKGWGGFIDRVLPLC